MAIDAREVDKQQLIQKLSAVLDHTETLPEAAARRGTSIDTIRRLIARGELDTIKIGRNVRVLWRELT